MTRLSRGVTGIAVAVLALVSALETGAIIGQDPTSARDRYGGECEVDRLPPPMPRGAWEQCIRDRPPLPAPPSPPRVAPPSFRSEPAPPHPIALPAGDADVKAAAPVPRGWRPPAPPAMARKAGPKAGTGKGSRREAPKRPTLRSPFPAVPPSARPCSPEKTGEPLTRSGAPPRDSVGGGASRDAGAPPVLS